MIKYIVFGQNPQVFMVESSIPKSPLNCWFVVVLQSSKLWPLLRGTERGYIGHVGLQIPEPASPVAIHGRRGKAVASFAARGRLLFRCHQTNKPALPKPVAVFRSAL